MTQKAEHNYQSDYQNAYSDSDGSKWIWAALAALVAIALIVWLASYSGPPSDLGTNGTTTTEQIAPTMPPAAPAADPVAPVQAPASGGTQNP